MRVRFDFLSCTRPCDHPPNGYFWVSRFSSNSSLFFFSYKIDYIYDPTTPSAIEIDLLDHIGIAQDDLEHRGRLNPIDVDLQRRSKRFSSLFSLFRRNVIPVSSSSSLSLLSSPTNRGGGAAAASAQSASSITTADDRASDHESILRQNCDSVLTASMNNYFS